MRKPFVFHGTLLGHYDRFCSSLTYDYSSTGYMVLGLPPSAAQFWL
jgi:hypothetical protein